MIIGKLLNPKLDYVFKRIFGSIGSEEITKDFLRAITKENITDIKLDCNPITEKDLYDEKISILDIKAKLNNNINCNIEMQIVDRKNIEKRILYYWSKMYTGSIKKGQDFDKLEKGIVVLISDYNLDNLKENNNYLTKWQIREEKTPKLILTDVLEIFIIELRKVSKDNKENSSLKAWLEFINNPEVKSKMGDREELIKAREILEDMSRTKRERYLAELREKYIMDKHAIHAAGYDKGLEQGLQEGLQEGLEQGLQEGLKQAAKKLKDEDVDIKLIMKATGLTEEEIKNL
ncbi:MAG: Rpn family recombination-promoting nuclease/putative transposase [Clostridia bacterium]|nr:Rpn family recombination-promoting nuclease/putative transposase [Clostridia bacterium]